MFDRGGSHHPSGATCFDPKWSHVLQPKRSHVPRPKMEPRASTQTEPRASTQNGATCFKKSGTLFHRCLILAAFKSKNCFSAYCSTRHSLGYYIRQQWPRNVGYPETDCRVGPDRSGSWKWYEVCGKPSNRSHSAGMGHESHKQKIIMIMNI